MAGKTVEQLEARVRELLQESDDSEEDEPISRTTTRHTRPHPPPTLPAAVLIEPYHSPIANSSTTRNMMLSRSEEVRAGGIAHTLEELKRTSEIGALRE